MGHLDPETALELIQTLLYWIACMCAGWAVVGLSAYIVFLCLEIFSPQPRSRARLAKVPHPAGCASVVEGNLDLFAAETPVLAEAESLGGEAVRVPALRPDAETRTTLIPVTPESEPTGPWGFPSFLRFQRAVVPQKRRSSLRANRQLEKPA